MATSEELFEKARLLRALADDLEVCCDAASTAAQGPTWDCDNATEVRGAIRGFRGAAGRAARGIRDHAHTVSQQARARQADEIAAANAAAGTTTPSTAEQGSWTGSNPWAGRGASR